MDGRAEHTYIAGFGCVEVWIGSLLEFGEGKGGWSWICQ